MQTEVLLREDVPPLGRRGELVRVSKGFARNYLFPRRLAMRPTQGNRRLFELEKAALARRDVLRRQKAQDVVAALESTSVTIEVNATPEGVLYGSVDARAIADAFRKAGVAVAPDMVHIDEPIKNVGVYSVAIRPHGDVAAAGKVWVVAATPDEKDAATRPTA